MTGRVVEPGGCAGVVDGGIRLEGSSVLVTGAGRGIGKATAERLAREGASVILLDRPEDEALVRETAKALGGEAFGLDIAAEDAG